jgi:hypothetical protein
MCRLTHAGTITTMWRNQAHAVAVVAFGCSVCLHATSGSHDIPRGALVSDLVNRAEAKLGTATPPLRVEHVRLEPAPAINTPPATILKFDLFNVSATRVTDVVLEVTLFVEEPEADRGSRARRVLVGPFTIRGSVVLESGYTVAYEMLLRSFSAECGCVANVSILSVRSLPD